MTEHLREIQLTSKKLVFVFMSAVLVAVVVFLLGVWVGRGIDPAASDVAGASRADLDGTVASTPPAEPGKLDYPNVLQGGQPATPPAQATPPPATPPVQGPPPAQIGPSATRLDTKPVPKPTPSPPPVTAAERKPAATGGWVVQAGAFSSRPNADGLAARLKAKGFAAFVISSPGGGAQFKVRVGPFANDAEARQAAARLSKEPGVTKPSVINTR